MRFNHRSPFHWLVVALVAIVALLTFGPARGQGSAAFEGRPAMSGAQGGLGSQGGMPQGGVGVQGNEAAQRQLNLSKPSGLDNAPSPALAAVSPPAVPGPSRSDVTLVPKKDEVGKEVSSPKRTVKRAAKRTLERSRTGVGGIDAGSNVPN